MKVYNAPIQTGLNAHVFLRTTGRVFDFCVAFYAKNQCWPTIEVIQQQDLRLIGSTTVEVAIADGAARHILKLNGQWVMACVPPHIEIIESVAAKMGIAPPEICGDDTSMHIVKARRVVVSRLRALPVPYRVAEIARVLNKHTGTVLDYISVLRAMRRSEHRKIRKLIKPAGVRDDHQAA